MSYQTALELNMAVLDFRSFGDYQGKWYAILFGQRVITGWYGSCDYCDAFQAEVGYDLSPEKYDAAAKEFGKRYIDDDRDLQSVIDEVREESSYDYSAKEVVEWLEGFL